MSKQQAPVGYVVCAAYAEKDGNQHRAEVVPTRARALQAAQEWHEGFCGRSLLYVKVFELGREVPLETVEEIEPGPPKVRTVVRLACETCGGRKTVPLKDGDETFAMPCPSCERRALEAARADGGWK